MIANRRSVLMMLAAGVAAPAAQAHTLYNQWVVFRQKHLLVGCHRKDQATYDLARDVVGVLDHLLPTASARPARAPHPERLASLLGTRQISLSVMAHAHAQDMRAGVGRFAPYGAIPLTYLENLGSHLLVGHADFPQRHAWLVSAALDEVGYGLVASPQMTLPRHPGAVAMRAGIALDDLPAES